MCFLENRLFPIQYLNIAILPENGYSSSSSASRAGEMKFVAMLLLFRKGMVNTVTPCSRNLEVLVYPYSSNVSRMKSSMTESR